MPVKKAVEEIEVPKEIKRYKLRVLFTEQSLGSSPCDPEVYAKFIATKARDEKIDTGEEVATIPVEQREQTGWTVFHKDEKGLFFFDYKVRGFLKEASKAITGKGITACHSKIDKWVFVHPRRLPLVRDGEVIAKPDGVLERPIRMMTMQGPRVALKRSDFVMEGTAFESIISVLPLGQHEITEKVLCSWLDYGQFSGFGDWRTGSYGRFTYTLEPME